MLQDIYEVSTTQYYRLGMRYALDDRVYRYARSGGTLHNKWLAKTAVYQSVMQAALADTSLIGSREISITVAATDGVYCLFPAKAADGSFAEDELAEGYLCAQTRLDQGTRGYLVQRKILHNSVVSAPGGLMVITVDKPLSYDLTSGADAFVDCMQSPYANVQTATPGEGEEHFSASYCSCVGAPTMAALINEYLWLQTWGPYVAQADVVVGTDPNNRQVAEGPDGNLHPVVASDAFNTTQGQKIGYVLCNSNDVTSRGAPFIYLQLAP